MIEDISLRWCCNLRERDVLQLGGTTKKLYTVIYNVLVFTLQYHVAIYIGRITTNITWLLLVYTQSIWFNKHKLFILRTLFCQMMEKRSTGVIGESLVFFALHFLTHTLVIILCTQNSELFFLHKDSKLLLSKHCRWYKFSYYVYLAYIPWTCSRCAWVTSQKAFSSNLIWTETVMQ